MKIREKKFTQLTACASAGAMLMGTMGGAIAQTVADRTVLPVQEPKRPLYKELDARDATMPPHFEVKAPAGAPNVVIIPLQDILGLGKDARMNRPSISHGNGEWRMLPGQLTQQITERLLEMTISSGRSSIETV